MATHRFRNLDGSGPQPFSNVLKWGLLDRVSRKRVVSPPGPPAPAVERPTQDLAHVPHPGEGARLTWLGHASWLVQLDGVSLLIDPVLSPSLGGIVRRYAAMPVGVTDLPRIDATLVTHSHRDHLDVPTVRKVGSPIVSGTGVGRYLKRLPTTELEWWKTTSIGPVRITLVPSQHWSNRGLGDFNTSLWGGFVIEGSGGAIYHSGDTAYFDGFAEIGRRFPRLKAALLPIGAYLPEWFMRRQHMNPEDAVQAFIDLGAERFFAMHWGTFQLTDESLSAPVEFFWRVWRSHGLPESTAHVLKVGESATLQV